MTQRHDNSNGLLVRGLFLKRHVLEKLGIAREQATAQTGRKFARGEKQLRKV